MINDDNPPTAQRQVTALINIWPQVRDRARHFFGY